MNATYNRLDRNRCEPAETRRHRRSFGLEDENGEAIGRDPRTMTQAELQALGHAAAPLSEIIRAKCLDCCCGSSYEVRRCISIDCALWPFRMGTNPWRKPMPEAERQRRGERLRNARAAPSSPNNLRESIAHSGTPATPLAAKP